MALTSGLIETALGLRAWSSSNADEVLAVRRVRLPWRRRTALMRLYSMSARFMDVREEYYAALEQTSSGSAGYHAVARLVSRRTMKLRSG